MTDRRSVLAGTAAAGVVATPAAPGTRNPAVIARAASRAVHVANVAHTAYICHLLGTNEPAPDARMLL